MTEINAPFATEPNTIAPMAQSGEWKPHPALAMVACVVASLVAFAVINQVYPVVPREDLPPMGPYPSAELVAQYNAAEIAFRSANDSINGSILGAITGLLLGAMTARKRALGAVMAAILGAAAGGLAGYIAGTLVANAINQAGAQSTVQSVSFLTLLWGLIAGVVCGSLATIHNAKKAPLALVGGLVIGGIAALLYNIVASVAFPMSNLVLITPNTALERCVWAICFGIILGVGIAVGFRPDATKSAPAPRA